MRLKLLTIVGARPQFIKAATVSRILRDMNNVSEIIVHTGQHYDPNMSDIFFKELDIPKPDYNLEIGSGSHGYQTGTMLIKIEELLLKESPDMVIIYGDTNSTIAGALAAVKLHIPIAHIEAGLRSYNRMMPEEINRIAADHLSDLLFAPTETACTQLADEGLAEKTIMAGDVMCDSVLYYKGVLAKEKEEYGRNKFPETYCLATIHRPINTDQSRNLESIINAFSRFECSVVFPVHPRVAKMISNFKIKLPDNVITIEPVGYLNLLSLIAEARKVITDSGGIQKEAYILGKPCITLREETEWVETLHDNWNILVGANEEKIVDAERLEVPAVAQKDFYGEGKAAIRIVDCIIKFVANRKTQELKI